MNVALWIAAGLLALAVLAAGLLKLSQPKEKLAERMRWVEGFSQSQVRTIAVLEVLGAVGLILPGLLHVAVVLVPLAATGLALTMAGAIITHVRLGEPREAVTPAVLFCLAVFVAWGRFGPYPLPHH